MFIFYILFEADLTRGIFDKNVCLVSEKTAYGNGLFAAMNYGKSCLLLLSLLLLRTKGIAALLIRGFWDSVADYLAPFIL